MSPNDVRHATLDPTSPTAAPSRPIAARLLLGAAAALVLSAALRVVGYAGIVTAVDNSGLATEPAAAVRGLWIASAVEPAVIAGILAVAGWRPGTVARPALVVLSLLPLVSGAVQASFRGSALPAVLPALAVVLTLVAVVLPSGARSRPED